MTHFSYGTIFMVQFRMAQFFYCSFVWRIFYSTLLYGTIFYNRDLYVAIFKDKSEGRNSETTISDI